MLDAIRDELNRLLAVEMEVSETEEFEPEAGTLIRLDHKDAYWHLLPAHLLELLRELPDEAGSEAVKVAIEKKAAFVWHGPEPEGSRDT